jgi:large subunit ribosomal protein L24
MVSKKFIIKKDDKVKIITGKDNGKIGKILEVLPNKKQLIVENINIVKRHTKPNMTNSQGGIIKKEAPIHVSNVMLMCNRCVNPTRVKIKILEDGKKVRVCKKCNETIDA